MPMGAHPSPGVQLEATVELSVASDGNFRAIVLYMVSAICISWLPERKVQTCRCSHRVFGNPQCDAF